ncbi:hypothetical protein [Sphingobium xenophagum]|uniref:hypothetical protein n=1 Tax=Sphingobium xenophagum TaxID=121428 RepID=UPI0012FC8A4E|nr:hypothetical protein [Sphingobium xenophagum]
MDDVLKKLIEQRDQAIQAAREWQERVENLNALVNSYQDLISGARKPRRDGSQQADLFAAPAMNRAERSKYVFEMMDAAEEIIMATKRPLTRSELLDALQSRGFHIEGGDKSKVLGTNIWRSKRFHNIKGVGYWPKRHPLPDNLQDHQLRSSMLG